MPVSTKDLTNRKVVGMKEQRDDWSVVVRWWNRTEGRRPRDLLDTLECLVNNQVGVVPGCEELSHPINHCKKNIFICKLQKPTLTNGSVTPFSSTLV